MTISINNFSSERIPAELVANAEKTILILNEIFAAFPGRFRFTSGYRSPAKNKSVGGVPDSYHVKALAGDFVPVDGRYPIEEKVGVNAIAAKHGYEVLIHKVNSGLHYHIEPLPGKRQRR
ncbi:MAG TPA: D-Ala-D-Ala carboxypeptidase family metallohydrolase [Pyrinomonadaceae bacterium]|jgi:hypothetical protein